jgi:hypothetical protein
VHAVGKTITQEFAIGGFSEIGTGARDYGMGIVRIDPRFIANHPAAARWRRHVLLRLDRQTTAGQVYAVLRTINPASVSQDHAIPLLCLEYDDRLVLGVAKGEKATIRLSKASLWGRFQYFRNHPNIMVRSYTRYTFITGVFTALLGAMTWALLRRFSL